MNEWNLFGLVCSLKISLYELGINPYKTIYPRINNFRYHEHKRTILLFTTHWFSRFSRNWVSNDCIKCLISHLFIPCLIFVYWYCKIIVLKDASKILDIENIGLYCNNSIATVASLGNMHKWIILVSKDWLYRV